MVPDDKKVVFCDTYILSILLAHLFSCHIRYVDVLRDSMKLGALLSEILLLIHYKTACYRATSLQTTYGKGVLHLPPNKCVHISNESLLKFKF